MIERPRGAWRVWAEEAPLPADAERLFAHLYGDRPVAVWFDSARRAYGMGSWSMMGAPELPRDRVLALRGGRVSLGDTASGDDLWSELADRVDAHPIEPCGLPFTGGFVGSAGYGAKAIGRHRDNGGPDAQLVHLSRFLLIDHERDVVHVVATGPAPEEAEGRAWIAETRRRIARVPDLPEPAAPPRAGVATASVTPERYRDDLRAVRQWFEAGDSYEACYTYRLGFRHAEAPFEVYRRLRRRNPAPYAAYLRLPGREVLSCSPERYLTVTPAGWAETKPIKGTVRRVADPGGDAAAARALAADPKMRAENLMIVDLLRNDLGRISAPGTVEVPALMAVESYATVHQLVTSVRSKLLPRAAAGVRAAEALFPPGSMTGAPKRRTVELLDELEAEPRGVYSGVIGWFSRCGAVDLSVVIRTAVIEDGRVTIGTGGAITIDSDPDAEAAETVTKSAALLEAFGRSHPFA